MWSDSLDDGLRAKIQPERPGWVEPMLARLHDGPLPQGEWVFERKFDGQRVSAICDPADEGTVKLVARSGIDVTRRYPDIALALPDDRAYVLDGELVVFENGIERFSLLQKRMHSDNPDLGVPVRFVVFDCLNLDNMDLRQLPLQTRSRLVREVGLSGRCAPVPQASGDADRLLRGACEAGWEGLIAKRFDAPYMSRRSGFWLKLKCLRQGNFVIGGYTAPQGSRAGFGALLLGEPTDEGLTYVGKVGTGFARRELQVLHKGLKKIERPGPPFVVPPVAPATWVQPVLSCKIGYTARTPDGRLRHPRFLGLQRGVARRQIA